MNILDFFFDDRISGQDVQTPSFPERFLYHIWDEQHIKFLDKDKFQKTVSGKDVKIHFQGHFNTMSGADFKNAIIEIGNKNYTGDVEIHLTSSDWYHHQHDSNPAYNSVVLHVVLKHNHQMDITLNEKCEKIEILELKDIISEDIEKLFKRYSETEYKVKQRYCGLFSIIRPEFYETFLEKSGMERLEKKIKRFQAELSFVSMDQLFYQSILEAMGYSKNKHQFYLFSKEHNWIGFKQKYAPPPTHTSWGGLDRADFIQDIIEKAEFDTKKYGWYLFRIRPCNHPKTRLNQIAPFIYDTFFTSMTSEVVKLFSFTEKDFTLAKFKKRLYERFTKNSEFGIRSSELIVPPPPPLISTDVIASSLATGTTKGGNYKIGQDRLNTIVINIFVPILIIYANIMNDPELTSLCYRIYKEFQGLEDNTVSQIMKKYMTEEQFIISQKKAIYQQGILNIYHKYCINNLCKLCRDNMNEELRISN